MIKKIIKNKYFWMSFFFIIWISFFDKNSLMAHYKIKKTMEKMVYHKNLIQSQMDHK
ncbi:hypothetical protein [Blattabacterium cuenoti]|uniref:hypothetical protein n=1 Tax=Blattabacterium cuenoti TaxID=1653831 RepID=UPI00163B7716|nr:hypothetical protein [Blattabacterium cuenoti]